MSHYVAPHCVIAELTCRDNKDFIDSVTALFSGQCTSLWFTWMLPLKKKTKQRWCLKKMKMTLQDVIGCHSLTLVFLQENDLGIGAEVLPGQDHLLASQNRAAVHVLLLHHGKLVCWSLGCRETQRETGGAFTFTVARTQNVAARLQIAQTHLRMSWTSRLFVPRENWNTLLTDL